jgi:hypothetical protein
MTRRFPLLIPITMAVLVLGAYNCFAAFKVAGLPFDTRVVDTRTAVIKSLPGIPLPAGLQLGDRIDLPALDQGARIAFVEFSEPRGHSYKFAVRRGATDVTVPVSVVDRGEAAGQGWFQWSFVLNIVLSTGIALLLLWRGRDRAALGMAIWLIAAPMGFAGALVPADGILGLGLVTFAESMYLLARVGFYIMIEAGVGQSQSAQTRRLYRGAFVLLLLAGVVLVQPLPPLIYVFTGWAGMLSHDWSLVQAASYILPVVMLAGGYVAAERAQRQRLRWMLWSGVLWAAAYLIGDTRLLGFQMSLIVGFVAQGMALLGFLYAVLRHRVVDVSVVIDHTLVYGGVTALVVGVLAAVNSLVEHAALGAGASLLLQVLVPLALGIVLTRVRAWLDRVVEQVFFRKRYRADKSLRRFARHAAEYGKADEMMQAALLEIHETLGVPGVAVYESGGEGYRRVYQVGQQSYPEHIKADDAAFVAVRADRKDIDLGEFHSGLGMEGHLFPMRGYGGMRGVIVCANRPGERYASDERKLLAYLAHHLGMALHIIDARRSREFVRAVAHGEIEPQSVKAFAQTIELGWAIS